MTGAARRMLGIITVAIAVIGVTAVILTSRARTGERPKSPQEGSGPSSTQAAKPTLRERPASGEAQVDVPRPGGEGPPLPSLPVSRGRVPRALSIMRPKDTTTPVAPPKPEEVAISRRLSAVLERHPGGELMFVACDQDTPPCRARLQARDLDAVLAMSREVSGSFAGHVGIKVHEYTDAFTGRYFRAELEVDTSDARPVPTGIEAFP